MIRPGPVERESCAGRKVALADADDNQSGVRRLVLIRTIVSKLVLTAESRRLALTLVGK